MDNWESGSVQKVSSDIRIDLRTGFCTQVQASIFAFGSGWPQGLRMHCHSSELDAQGEPVELEL